MAKISLYNIEGKEIDKIELPKEVFDVSVNKKLIAQAVRVYLANKRQGTASTKTRGEVAGSTRKIYRQKGTGRARHGSIRAPIFRKGGIVFGPKPREYRLELPKKMKMNALRSVLTQKLQDKSIFVVDGLDKIKQKTKEIVKVFNNLKFQPEQEKIILVTNGVSKNIIYSARNLQKTKLTDIKQINVYDLLNSNKILFTKDAILTFSDKKEEKSTAEKIVKKHISKVKHNEKS